MKKFLCIALLSVVMLNTTACNPAWINIALNDLPILVQIALNIVGLKSAVQGQPPSPEEEAAVKNISNEAATDLKLVQTLYQDYKAAPSDSKRDAILAGIQTVQTNLTGLLATFHVKNDDLQSRVVASVNLVLGVVSSIALLVPGAPNPTNAAIGPPPTAHTIKARYNANVCRGVLSCELK